MLRYSASALALLCALSNLMYTMLLLHPVLITLPFLLYHLDIT